MAKSIIFKNWHFSLPMLPWPVSTTRLRRRFLFGESCRYCLGSTNQSDWNMLTGFTFGCPLSRKAVHNNSIRIAWRYVVATDKIQLCWYVYKDGKRFYGEDNVWQVSIGEDVVIHMFKSTVYDDQWLVYVNRIKQYIPIKFPEALPVGWLCFPYFGGNRKAPHTIVIHRKKYRA